MRKSINYINLFVTLSAVISCNLSSTNPNVLSSITIDNKQDRIAILKREVRLPSEIFDTEFDLVNANGFSNQRETVPGASSLYYGFVVKVDTNDISKWTNGLRELPDSKLTFNWLNKLPEYRKKNWQTDSTSTFYIDDKDEGVAVVVQRHEGIIFKKISSD